MATFTSGAAASAAKPAPAAAANPGRPGKVQLAPGFSQLDWHRLLRAQKDPAKLKGAPLRGYTLREIGAHNKKYDCWLALRGKVYNVSHYFPYHPGGPEQLMRGAGRDATALFDEFHPWLSIAPMLGKCCVGWVVDDEEEEGEDVKDDDAAAAGNDDEQQASARGLDAVQWRRFALQSRETVSARTVRLRFALPEGRPWDTAGEGPGVRHVECRAPAAEGEAAGATMVAREYTPVSDDAATGHFDLLVKVYRPHGKVSRFLGDLAVGQSAEFRGPFGAFGYARGRVFGAGIGLHAGTGAGASAGAAAGGGGGEGYAAGGLPAARLLLCGGGSGVTPLLAIARRCAREWSAAAQAAARAGHSSAGAVARVWLLFANSAAANIIARAELEDLARKWAPRLTLVHVLSDANDADADDADADDADLDAALDEERAAEDQQGAGDGAAAAAAAAAAGQSSDEAAGGAAAPVRVWQGRIGGALRDAALALPAPAADTFVLWCGPPGFNGAVRGAATEIGHAESRCFEF